MVALSPSPSLPPSRRRRLSLAAHASRYVAGLAATVLLLTGLCLALNMLVDPLWYFRGNLLTGITYTFNERLAKVVRFLPRQNEYDCLLLGSSHSALLAVDRIPGHRCYNMSFSHARVRELIPYAKYLRERGFRPSLVIINVDRYDFLEVGPPNVPAFITKGDRPPAFLTSYLSLDTLAFSLRTLQGDFPNRLVYDSEFRMHIIPRRRWRHPVAVPNEPPFDSELAQRFIELRQMFPEARAIGFTPPNAAWYIGQLERNGKLDAYLQALERISKEFDVFLDFSVPSATTISTTNSFDGGHYEDQVNEATVAALAAGHAPEGADWHRESPSVIRARYEARLRQFGLWPR